MSLLLIIIVYYILNINVIIALNKQTSQYKTKTQILKISFSSIYYDKQLAAGDNLETFVLN